MPQRVDEFAELCRAWEYLPAWKKKWILLLVWWDAARRQARQLGQGDLFWACLMSGSAFILVDGGLLGGLVGVVVGCYYLSKLSLRA